jgi:hypothetical protein
LELTCIDIWLSGESGTINDTVGAELLQGVAESVAATEVHPADWTPRATFSFKESFKIRTDITRRTKESDHEYSVGITLTDRNPIASNDCLRFYYQSMQVYSVGRAAIGFVPNLPPIAGGNLPRTEQEPGPLAAWRTLSQKPRTQHESLPRQNVQSPTRHKSAAI